MRIFSVLFLVIVLGTLGAAGILFYRTFHTGYLESRLTEEFENLTGCRAHLGRLSIDPELPLVARFENVVFQHPHTGKTIFSADEIAVEISLSQGLRGYLYAKNVTARGGYFYLIREDAEHWNLSGLRPVPAEGRPRFSFRIPMWPGLFLKQWDTGTPFLRFETTLLEYEDKTADPGFRFLLRGVEGRVRRMEAQGMTALLAHGRLFSEAEADIFLSAQYFGGEDSARVRLAYGRDLMLFEGGITKLREMPGLQGRFEAALVDIQELARKAGVSLPFLLEGQAHLDTEIAAVGTNPLDWARSLELRGVADIRSGRIGPVNVLHQVLQGISKVAGLEDLPRAASGSRLGDLYGDRGTVFEAFRADIAVSDENLWMNNIQLKHPDYFIEAGVDMGLETREWTMSGRLVLFEGPGDVLGREVPALRRLRNESGRMVIPFASQGLLPGVTLLPDIVYVADKVVETRVAEPVVPPSYDEVTQILGA